MSSSNEIPDLNLLSQSELIELLRLQTGIILKRSVERARLIELLEYGGSPKEEEINPSMRTRKSLQLYIEKNWNGLNSQLPCSGKDMGRCTIYPCPEGRHIDCLISATPHMRVHSL